MTDLSQNAIEAGVRALTEHAFAGEGAAEIGVPRSGAYVDCKCGERFVATGFVLAHLSFAEHQARAVLLAASTEIESEERAAREALLTDLEDVARIRSQLGKDDIALNAIIARYRGTE